MQYKCSKNQKNSFSNKLSGIVLITDIMFRL